MSSPRLTDDQLALQYGRRDPGAVPLFEPAELGYHCPNGHTGSALVFSEFREHLWCYPCSTDYHYAQDCFLVRPEWMTDKGWRKFLQRLPAKPVVRSGISFTPGSTDKGVEARG